MEADLTIIAKKSRLFREQKNKEYFPPVEDPLQPHLFSVRKQEERRSEVEEGWIFICTFPSPNPLDILKTAVESFDEAFSRMEMMQSVRRDF